MAPHFYQFVIGRGAEPEILRFLTKNKDINIPDGRVTGNKLIDPTETELEISVNDRLSTGITKKENKDPQIKPTPKTKQWKKKTPTQKN